MNIMHNILNIDLNLLKLFTVLYQNGSVSETADALNISQSACSHALTRLRHKLDNDLFIRIDNKMIPTQFSEHLAAKILPAMELLQVGLQPREQFNPDTDTTYTIAATDYTAWCLKPLIEYMHQHHPRIAIRLITLEQRIPEEKLKTGQIDFACGFSHQAEQSQSIFGLTWLTDSYVTLTSKQHPLAFKTTLSIEDFISYQHILIAPWNEGRGVVDKALIKNKVLRDIALTTPFGLSAPFMLIGTHWILTLPRKYAQYVSDKLALKIHQPPITIPEYKLKLYSHKTRQQDPKIIWFSGILQKIFNPTYCEEVN